MPRQKLLRSLFRQFSLRIEVKAHIVMLGEERS
jgi:hypothetical protein